MYLHDFAMRFSFNTDDIPDSLTFFLQIVFMLVTEDFAFHLFHKLAHWKVLYPYFHKHHHSFETTVSVVAEHFHPVDYFIGILIPGTFGPNILGKNLHMATYLAWVMLRTAEGVDGHCGYEFPWSPFRLIPFSGSASYHDFHHSHNVGNYSSQLTIWDTVFGDNTAYVEYMRAQEEKKK
jgi:sterol desaturase/sphingolipid hydroxylase (fatty acid hydroxylase superfamily)